MTNLVALLLTALTFAFIAYPFFRRKPALLTESGEDPRLEELHSRRDTTYSMLKELEFDFRSGILTEDDYRALESRYKGKAISILKNIDNLDTADDVDGEIERLVAEQRQGGDRFCPQCGGKVKENARFCYFCGASMEGYHD